MARFLLAIAALLAVLSGASHAFICSGVTAPPDSSCDHIWFACVQLGTAFVDDVGLEFGEGQSSVKPWTITQGSSWSATNPNGGWKKIQDFHQFGVAANPLSTSKPIGQGQWACTLDNDFTYSPLSDYTTGALATSIDLYERPSPSGSSYLPWPIRGVGARAIGGQYININLVDLNHELKGVPKTVSPPPPGSSLSTLTSGMLLLGSPSSGAVNVQCYASSFNPCMDNGCPANNIRVGANSACCPTNAVIVGDGTAANPARCCPANTVPVPVPPSNSQYLCCPSGQVAMRDGATCCPTARYVSWSNGDTCCPIDNPVCQGKWTSGCNIVDQGTTTPNRCCPENRANKLKTTCCPTPVSAAGCNFRKRALALWNGDDEMSSNVRDERAPNVDCNNPQWQTTQDGNQCCPPAQVTEGLELCCPTAPPSGEFWVKTTNQNCCPSSKATKLPDNSKYCCPSAGTGTVYTDLSPSGQPDPCCPLERRSRQANNGAQSTSGQSYCCPSAPATGQTWCRTKSSASDGNNDCCPCSQAVGSGTSSYCCPGTGPYVTNVPLSGPTGQDQWCCPVARWNGATGSSSYCCPASCTSPQSVTDGVIGETCGGTFNCCPASKVVLSGQNRYCCPDKNTYSWLSGKCCPNTNIAKDGTGSNPQCCDQPNAAVTSNNDCCTAAVSCRGGSQSCTKSNSYCCVGFTEQTNNPLWWTTGGATGTGYSPQCCPADHVATDRQNNAYCCPTAGANQRYDTTANQCCPQANYDQTTGTCCASALASVSVCSGGSCESNKWGTPGTCSAGEPTTRTELLCCQSSTTTQKCGCPNNSWSTSNCDAAACPGGCCPQAQVAYSDYPRELRSQVCCPATGGPYQLTRTQNCCPVSKLGQCASGQVEWCDVDRNSNGNRGPLCCPAAGQYAADVVIFRQWDQTTGGSAACDETSGGLGLTDCVDSNGNKYSGCPAGVTGNECFCCPAANTLRLDSGTGCSNSLYCCPSAASGSNTIVARSQYNNGDYVCCPASNARSSSGLPTQTGGVYANYNPSDYTCCPATSAVYTPTNPCCANNGGNVLYSNPAGHTGACYCCPATTRGLPFNCASAPGGCDCSLYTNTVARRNGLNLECCPDIWVVKTASSTWRCCFDSPYATNPTYSGQQFVNTANEQCCPQALVISDGNGGFLCCDPGSVAAPNGNNNKPMCCPAGSAVTIYGPFVGDNGLTNWCCPATAVAVPNGACSNCLASKSCANCFYCSASGSVAWNTGSLDWTIPAGTWKSSWGAQCASQGTGCCPANRVVDDRVCCPDSSWLPSGATGWVSGLATGTKPLTKYNSEWWPNGCCPNTYVQINDRGDAPTACCPGPQYYLVDWADSSLPSSSRDCCPASNRVLPPDYATLLAQHTKLTDQNGAFCCPTNTAAGVPPAGGWAWWISADRTQRCCPRNFLLGPSGPLTAQPTPPTDDKLSFLCCPGAATDYVFTPPNAVQTSPQCCPTSGSVTPVNLPGQPVCCPECSNVDLFPSGCKGTIYWSRTGTKFGCCPVQPESVRVADQPGATPALLDPLNNCCPGVVTPTRTIEKSCCAGTQVLTLPNMANVFDYAHKHCCPDSVTNPQTTAEWVRTIQLTANGQDASTQNGAYSCCPKTQINQKVGTTDDANRFCCPATTDQPTVEGTCCPTAQVISGDGASHCCPSSAAGKTWAETWNPTTKKLQAASCCPNNVLSNKGVCCPSSYNGVCATLGCVEIGTEPCCPVGYANDKSDTCCWGVDAGAQKTDNDNCCPAAQVATYTGPAGSLGKYCCPTNTGGSSAVVVPAATGGGFTCCPADRVITDESNVLHCCPTTVDPAKTLWRPTFDPKSANSTNGKKVCCPVAQVNVATGSLVGNDVCCPAAPAGTVYQSTTDTKCCADVPTAQQGGSYVACCPSASMTVVADHSCCPSVRVTNDGSGLVCCPESRWNSDTQTCCPTDQTLIDSADGSFRACCPDTALTPNHLVCCLSAWWNGIDVSKDATGECCATSVQAATNSCCPAEEKDYRGMCCPNTNWGLSLDTQGNTHNRSCCLNGKDCAGYCLPTNATAAPVYTTDWQGSCCLTVSLDCNATCAAFDDATNTSYSVNEVDLNGKCCPPGKRDCQGRCYGNDVHCCEVITNCTGCLAQQGCGWCGSPVGDLSARCQSGDFFGPTDFDENVLAYNNPDQCPSTSWLFDAKSTVQVQEGGFGPNNAPPDLQWKRQVVVLAPGDPIEVTISVRAPSNIPLDLFFLQDVTQSFDDDMKTVNATIGAFLDNITNVVPDVWFGWASFMDKPIAPFGTYAKGLPGREEYVFQLDVPLSKEKQPVIDIYNSVASITLSGGADIPEDHLEAMLALSDTTGTVRNVGWRPEGTGIGGRAINRIVLIITDTLPKNESYMTNKIAQGTNPNLGPLSSWDVNNLDPYAAPGTRMVRTQTGEDCPSSSLCETLPGLQERYPNQQDVADIWSARSIFPIFLVAPTEDINGDYGPTAGLDAMTEFAAMFAGGRALVAPISLGSTNLQEIVISALQTVTQTIALIQRVDAAQGPSPFMDYSLGTAGIMADPNNPAQASPGTILNYTIRLYWDGTPACTDVVTTFCVPQPHVIPFDALFPIQGIVFETGTVEVVLGQPASCGFCPDGVTQTWLGEQCDPLDPTLLLPDGSPNPCCSPSCTWLVDTVCDESNVCAPRYCAADGTCQVGYEVECINEFSDVCSFNTCVPATGMCEWACRNGDTGALCCDDSDPCTLDYCLDGVCSSVPDPMCNCNYQNNCLACVLVNRTCVWDNDLALCMHNNVTANLTWPDPTDPTRAPTAQEKAAYKDATRRYAWDANSLAVVCLVGGTKKNNVGAIVGSVVGAAALCMAAMAALAFVIFQRARGNTLVPGSNADVGMDAAMDSPLYDAPANGGENPLFEGGA